MLRTTIQFSLLILGGLSLVGFLPNRNAAFGFENRNTYFVALSPTPDSTENKQAFNGYKGVTIGMTAANARAKLGTPKEKSDDQDFYVFSDNESAQVLYDDDHTVRVISVNYVGKIGSAPQPKDVVGSDIEAKPDGSMNKMVRFPKSGYWISYLRTGGDDPMVVITMQKMPREQ